jgi:squalene synthase HpnC
MTADAPIAMPLRTLDPRVPPVQLLRVVGPSDELDAAFAGGEVAPINPADAQRYCEGLAVSHYENFSVLSGLVPERLRGDFAAVYAFCRWSDDLADETGASDDARERSLRLLAWWRGELTRCFDDQPAAPDTHPVFIALRTTRARHPHLPAKPFHDLIDAFEQDQRVRAYRSWDQCVDYCTRSANPVGRIVLALAGYPETPENAERYRVSDATCTALQLINFWQDVRRDLLERDRVYLPEETTGISPAMLRDWANRPNDPSSRVPFIRAMTPLVDQTEALFAEGRSLPRTLNRDIAPVVWLFGAGGEAILSAVRRLGCATLWERPHLSRTTKAALVGRAWLKSKLGG